VDQQKDLDGVLQLYRQALKSGQQAVAMEHARHFKEMYVNYYLDDQLKPADYMKLKKDLGAMADRILELVRAEDKYAI